MDRDEFVLRLVTIIVLGTLLLAAIVGIVIVAVATNRDLWKAEALTFGGAVMLVALGGVTWSQVRKHRHRWRIEREDTNGHDNGG